MSYFEFINQSIPYTSENSTTSAILPVSIADELYESQTFSYTPDESQQLSIQSKSKSRQPLTLLSQLPAISRPSSTSQDYSNGIPSHESPTTSTAVSAFGFINQSIQQDDIQSVDEIVFASSKQAINSPSTSTSPYIRKPRQEQSTFSTRQLEIDSPWSSQQTSSTSRKTVEMQRMYEKSNWKRTKASKQHQKQLVQQLYEQRKVMIAEIQSSQALLRAKLKDQQQAKEDEDYDKLDKLIRQSQLVKSKIDRLKYDVWESTTQQLHTAWMKMATLIRAEGECASKAARMYQETKDERQQQLTQYSIDMKRKHNGLLEEIKTARSDIESGKSEVAFDLDFWKQAKAELDEKMTEAVQERTHQKNELKTIVDSTDEEIKIIKKKLEDLTQKRQSYIAEINNLEHGIEQSLLQYQPEMDAQEKEHQEIDLRKMDLEQQSNDLDQRDAALQQEMERCHQYEEQGWKEINDLGDAIRQATVESQTGATDSDTITNILNKYIFDRDRTIKEMAEKQKTTHDEIARLTRQIEQQQNEYNAVQQRMDDYDTRLNFSKIQKTKMERQKSRAVEQEQYQLAAKWQERIKQIDVASDQDTKALADNQIKLDELDSDLKTTREQLNGLLMKNNTQERESAEATITLLDDSEKSLTRFNKSFWILENELDSIRHWKSYFEQYLTTCE